MSPRVKVDTLCFIFLHLIYLAVPSTFSDGVPDPYPTQPPVSPSLSSVSVHAPSGFPPAAEPPSIVIQGRRASTPPSERSDNQIQDPYQRVTVLIAVLFAVTIVIGFSTQYMLVGACSVMRRDPGPSEPAGGEQLGHDGGVQPWVLVALPTVKYSVIAKRGEEQEQGSRAMAIQECAVCLSEFGEDDELKELPKCGHAFHSACIDRWLLSHITCPICRVMVVPPDSLHPPPCRELAVIVEHSDLPDNLESRLNIVPPSTAGSSVVVLDDRMVECLPGSRPTSYTGSSASS